MITIDEYEKMLKNHDWFYYMSNDNTAYERGLDRHNNLIRLASTSSEHAQLFKKYKDKIDDNFKEHYKS